MKFCDKQRVVHEFSSARTLQQNGVVERTNISLIDISRTMLSENSLFKYFWT